jgi:hypothetical protein
LAEIMDAAAGQLEEEIGMTVDGLQVDGKLVFNPTPPCIDIYPGDPLGEQISMGADERELLFTIRARVSTADHEAGQDLLLSLMDRNGGGSVIGAIASDRTLNGKVDDCTVDGPSGYIAYQDASGANAGSLLGCEWRLRVLP